MLIFQSQISKLFLIISSQYTHGSPGPPAKAISLTSFLLSFSANELRLRQIFQKQLCGTNFLTSQFSLFLYSGMNVWIQKNNINNWDSRVESKSLLKDYFLFPS